jgi:RNA polymerase sigma factor (sigma-70 family)
MRRPHPAMTILAPLCNEAAFSNEHPKESEPAIARDQWDSMMREALLGREEPYRRLLGEVAEALRGVVRAALARAGRGNADAEDVVQDVLVAIHLKRATWDQAQPLSPWINAITRYKLIDALRRQGLRQHVPIEDVAEALPAEEDDATDRSDARRLLQRLKPRDRVIVESLSLRGQSIRETAEALGMQEGAVRVALHRALKKLAAMLRDGGREH